MTAIGLVVAAVMAALSGLHVVWAFGGVTGKSAVIPSRNGVPVMRPGRVSTIAVAVGLAIAAFVALAAAAVVPWPIPAIPATIGCLVIAVLFAARAIGEFRYVGFFKRVRGTEFAWWDTRVYSPLCIAISAGYALLWSFAR
ncbi:MAG: DUF3995 domain-containing protein [Blastocatellia bacterium]|jgi:hypothetical protein|nr:DUF3995 domain-containing protein [Blastocatellia bacterium]